MGNDHHRDTGLRQHADNRLYLADHTRVQGAGRLVKENDIRIHGECSGDGDTLLLSGRKVLRIVQSLRAETNGVEQGHRFVVGFLPGTTEQSDLRIHDVFDDRQVPEQVEGLENHAHFFTDLIEVAFAIIDDLPIHDDLAGGRRLQHIDAPQQGGLAGAGRSDYGDYVAGMDGDIDVLQRCHIFEFFS